MTKLISICVLTLGFSVAAQANHEHGACKKDVENFCHDVKKGGGRIMKCMKEHKDQLSAGCKEEIEKKKEAHKAH